MAPLSSPLLSQALSQRSERSRRPQKPTAPEDILLYPTLQLEIIFDTLEEAKDLITDAIAAANKSFSIKNSKSHFWHLECRGRETSSSCRQAKGLALFILTTMTQCITP